MDGLNNVKTIIVPLATKNCRNLISIEDNTKCETVLTLFYKNTQKTRK